MKKMFLYIAIGLLLLAIPATVFFVGQQRDIRTKAAPATTLALTPAQQTVTVEGSSIKLNVDIDPGANQVISANIYLTYDPTKLEAKTITNGSSAPRVLNSGIIENGTASIKVGAASNTQPITTRGTIAIVTFTAKAETNNFTPTIVQFASNTFVGGLNEPTANVLVSSAPAKITITSAGNNGSGANFASGNATSTPTPTITPTTTGLLTPTLTPTISDGNQEGTPSALQIVSPEQDAEVSTSQPVIQGKALPGSVVTIVIHSDAEITVTVTADADGNWVYTPTTSLDPGLHSVVASAEDEMGVTQTSTTSFVVASAGGIDDTDASVSAVPISGSFEITLLLLSLGILLIASGIIIPLCF